MCFQKAIGHCSNANFCGLRFYGGFPGLVCKWNRHIQVRLLDGLDFLLLLVQNIWAELRVRDVCDALVPVLDRFCE